MDVRVRSPYAAGDTFCFRLLKISEFQLLEGDDKPFSDLYGTTSSTVLTEFLSPQEIMDSSEEDLLAFLAAKNRNLISEVSRTSELLRKAARNSYRLNKCMYDPVNISLANQLTVSGNTSLNTLNFLPESMPK